MTQADQVYDAMKALGGEARFPELIASLASAVKGWKTKTPAASIHRIVQMDKRFFHGDCEKSRHRSIWITGTYGSGKSYAAFVLQKLFTDDESRVQQYFAENADILTSTLAKLPKGEDVNTSVLGRICDALNCGIRDIVDSTADKPMQDGRKNV